MKMPQRRKVVVGFALAGATLATAGPAFACVVFKGQMILTGPDALTHMVTGGGDHTYCSPNGHPEDGGPIVAGNVSGQTIHVDIAPATCGKDADGKPIPSVLGEGQYQVALVNGPAFSSTGYFNDYNLGTATDWGCWSTSPAYAPSQKYTGVTALPGSAFTIDAFGFGSTTITVPSLPIANEMILSPSDASVLCVGKAIDPRAPGNDGIFAPFTVVMI